MSYVDQGRPLPELISGLVSDISGLFRKEIQLAKTEASEKLSELTSGAVSVLIGAVLAIGAIGVLLAAIVSVVAAVLVGMGMEQTTANAVAGFVVAIIVGLIGWVFVSKGLKTFKGSNLNLNRTTHSLAQDAAVVKEKF